jgi:hypothetical protein
VVCVHGDRACVCSGAVSASRNGVCHNSMASRLLLLLLSKCNFACIQRCAVDTCVLKRTDSSNYAQPNDCQLYSCDCLKLQEAAAVSAYYCYYKAVAVHYQTMHRNAVVKLLKHTCTSCISLSARPCTISNPDVGPAYSAHSLRTLRAPVSVVASGRTTSLICSVL